MADSFRDGIIQPTLIKQLQNILHQYPDDGQILKELIQNAEDAGARTIKFMYDKSHYSTDKLYNTALSEHQGPALYAYNDAVFSEDDWKGIRMIQDSIKAKDPLKVGRFGLGFKSVFHITDLPGIMSGKQIGYLDPLEKFFTKREMRGSLKCDVPTSSYAWDLSPKILEEYKGQFQPFMHRIFYVDESTFTKGEYKGTVFRFPIRDKSSDISKTHYTDEKIQALVELLEKEGHFLILFLKHLESIEFYEKLDQSSDPQLKLCIKITSENKKLVEGLRKEFVEKVRSLQLRSGIFNDAPIHCKYILETDVNKKGSNLSDSRKWLVIQSYGGGNTSDLKAILVETQNLPIVGLALPLDEISTAKSGHVFCFLPMPLDIDNETGLNVHVNGYFAVDQNRRHLKWPSRGQSLEHSTDTDLKWNNFLLKQLIPIAMIELLQYAIQSNIDPTYVYNIFPEKDQLKEHWLPVFDKFVQNLQNLHCLHSIQSEWIRPSASYLLHNLEDEFKEVVKKVIIEGHVPLVDAPLHVLACVSNVTNLVDQSIIRQKLLMNDITLSNEEKMILIRYFFSNKGSIDHLFHLKLLPLGDGSFDKFEKPTNENTRYLETADCPNSLIPCRENLFVQWEIDPQMYNMFAEIAKSGRTQVKLLQVEQVPQLLKNRFQQTRTYIPYLEPYNIGDDWLKKLWKFILQNHASSLHKYESLPIVPVAKHAKYQWLELSTNIPYMAECTVERSLSDIGIKSETLKKLGIVIVKNWRELIGIYSNNEQLQRYISPPTVAGILDALMKVQNVDLFMNLSLEEKHSFKDAIGGEYRSHKPLTNHLEILKKMPLFKCYKMLHNTNEIWEPANAILCCSEFDYEFSLPQKVAKYNECQEFARIMSVETKTSTKILLDFVFPKILRGSDYTTEQIRNLMEQVLMKYDNWKRDYNFIKVIQSLPFISTKHRDSVKPSEVVDPSDAETKKLLELLDIFPTGKFAKVEYVKVLSQCGIFRSVSECDIVDLTKYIDLNELSDSDRYSKGMELLNYFNRQDHLVSDFLVENINSFRWVPVKTEKPTMYPTTMTWYGQSYMCVTPGQVLHSQHEYLVSSTKPLLPPLQICDNVLKRFDWKKSPDIKDVVLQLANIVSAVEGNTRIGNHEMFSLFIKEIYKFMNEQGIHKILQHIQLCNNWIWTGDSFTSNEHVVLQKPEVNAQPYVFHMPYDYQRLWSQNSLQQLGIKTDVTLTDILVMIKDHHDHQTTTMSEQQRDLKLCIAILHLLRDGNVEVPTKTSIPIRTESKEKDLLLMEIEKCVYCDQDTWKRKVNIQDVLDTEEVDEIYEIHEDIPLGLAKAIGVPSLITRYLDAEPLPIDYGQSEPLTRRIKSLLEDYTDGSSVLKELLQNADDAGASSVSFIYDLRDFTNEKGLLIDENMRCLQGPSLLCHNDAEFTAEDFANIVKLSGATKKEKTEKIGRFGLGFNAVYNLTDVPSFVSGNNIVIFDPQVKYLGDAIKDPLQPGIKLDLEGHGKKIQRFKAQFEPFQNIMGCDLVASKRYRGTLFRFPLRNRSSDISAKCYDLKEVQSLFNLFKQVAHSLLLFSQNVTQIKFYEIHHATELISKGEVTKTPLHLLKSMTGSTHSSHTTEDKWKEEMKVLYHAKNKMDNVEKRNHYIIKTDVHMKEGKLFTSPSQSSNHWSVSNVIGTGKSFEFAKKHPDRLPVGSIAVLLEEISISHYKIKPLMGQMFCFLPLPINCGMPFHVNGYFAVSSNRKQLTTQELYDKQNDKVDWNIALIEDAVTDAHICMLLDMTYEKLLYDLTALQESIFQLFPTSMDKLMEGRTNLMFHFTESFYRKVIEDDLSILPCTSGWSSFHQSKFPSEDITCLTSKEFPGVNQIIMEECNAFFEKDELHNFVNLPIKVSRQINKSLSVDALMKQIIHLQNFYKDIFLPYVYDIHIKNCNELLLFALLECIDELGDIIKEEKCIPVSIRSQRQYLKPDELVQPDGPLQNLYDGNEGPFPVWLTEELRVKLKPKIEMVLTQLGMRKEYLTNTEIIERAESIAKLQYDNGHERCICLLELLERTMKKTNAKFKELANNLQHIKMLPVLQKPNDWYLEWFSDQSEFLSITESFPVSQKELVGCSRLIATFPNSSVQLAKALGYQPQHVQLQQINEQLQNICTFIDSNQQKKSEYKQIQNVKSVAKEIYKYLNDLAKKGENLVHIKKNYCKRRFVLIDCKIKGISMISPEHCALQIFDGEPYLYMIPREVKVHTKLLLETIGIKANFDEGDYIKALERIHHEESCVITNPNTLTVIRNIATVLSKQIQSKPNITARKGLIYLPDTKGVMTIASELCYNNCPWYDSGEKRFLHKNIPFEEAECLGVKTVRQEMLSKFQSGIPFGQHEKLTNRIKRILLGYPCDKEILNELLQNADDAGASEIHFILDKRQHAKKKIFDPMWEPLQGPALLVYNDKPFLDDDLEGIQNLGEGSKSLDPLSTGKYGVGFNCVYHITDTPTFLTATEKGDDHLLIALDPQCKYVPGSDITCPGQRFNNMETTEQMFPDVYRCYHLNIDTSKGTLFRFPLRTAEMAKSSVISSKETRIEDVQVLFTKFKKSMEDCLLFLNSVREIKLSEIDENETLKEIAHTKATINDSGMGEWQAFLDHVKESAIALKQCNLEDVKVFQCQYQMSIDSNAAKRTTWLIVQQIGFNEKENITESLLKGYKDKKAALLPRGGVAYCLDKPAASKQNAYGGPLPDDMAKNVEMHKKEKLTLSSVFSQLGSVFSKVKTYERTNKVAENFYKLYCFLPLPIRVPYQMHINGYFVLDHETRRNLWASEAMIEFSVLWNKLIFSELISPCYNKVVQYLRNKVPVSGPYSKLNSELQPILNIMPNVDAGDYYMDFLERSIYSYMIKHETSVLPVLLRKHICKKHDQFPYSEETDLLWHHISSQGPVAVYFDNLSSQIQDDKTHTLTTQVKLPKKVDYVRNVLHNLRFPITCAKNHVLLKFAAVSDNLNASFIDADDVLRFLIDHKYLLDSIQIKDSALVDTSAHEQVLEYCKKKITKHLEGLPLLLTENGMLHTFRKNSPVLLSWYSKLIPSKKDLFAHRKFLNYNVENIKLYLKPMTCKDLDNLLKYELNEAIYLGEHKTVKFDPSNKRLMTWVIDLWSFIYDQSWIPYKDNKLTVWKFDDGQLQYLNKWCIMPVKSDTYEFWPSNRASSVINLHIFDDKNGLFRKMKFPEPYVPSLEYPENKLMTKMIQHIVSDFSKPDQIIIALNDAIIKSTVDFSLLNGSERETILSYFDDKVRNQMLESYAIAKTVLKKLPFYKGRNGSYTSLNSCVGRVYTVPNKIPMGKHWASDRGNVYLYYQPSLDELYKFVGIIDLEEEDAYKNHILHFFQNFSTDEQYDHLIFLRTIWEFNNKRLGKEKKIQALLNVLKTVPLIPNNTGILDTVSSFFDETIPVFKKMENNFPSSPYNTLEWIGFLRDVGLVFQITGNLVLKYARKIEAKYLGHHQTSLSEECSVLCEAIFYSNENILNEIANEIKGIAFLPSKRLSDGLRLLCNPIKMDILLPFQGSCISDHEELVWTKFCILSPGVTIKNENLAHSLGLITHPSLSDIIDNVRTVCSNPKISNLDGALISRTIIKFVKTVFGFIQHHHALEDSSQLKHIACVPVSDGTSMAKPTQVSCQIPPDIKEHVRPYLCALPLYLGEFEALLLKIGVTEQVQPEQYSNVLETIFMQSNGDELHPNEQKAALYAMKGLFEMNISGNKLKSVKCLHLQAANNKMYVSNNLVYLDWPRLNRRISCLPVPSFTDIHITEVAQMTVQDIRKAIRNLPENIRPKLISQIVKECLKEECLEGQQKTDRCRALQDRLSSNDFANGVIRIIRHNDKAQFRKSSDKEDLALVKKLHDISFFELNNVKTYLVYEEKRLPKSGVESPFFINRDDGISVYLSSSKMNPDNLNYELCRIINIIMKNKTNSMDMGFHLSSILSCDLDYIKTALDNADVASYDALLTDKGMKGLVAAGEYVPVKFHHLLNSVVELLRLGEMVAYEVYDPLDEMLGQEMNPGENDELAVFRYARVREVLKSDTNSYRDYRYVICLGDEEYATVHASELYRFVRPPHTSGPVVLSDKQSEDIPDAGIFSKDFENFPQIKSKITETLEEAWKMDEIHKRKIIKRLFLEWHPDKNPNCVKLATEVFKYIQNEIERLEKGFSRSEVDGGSYSGGYSGFNFNRYYGQRARSHRNFSDRYEEEYRNSSSGSSYFSPPKFRGKNPQPSEARRWMRQAEYDLLAVPSDMDFSHTSYEWACFKCHQAAEKALKATQFAVDANLKDNEHALYKLLTAINDDECHTLARELESLVKGSAAMRYPDRHYGGQTNHDAYTCDMAVKAKDMAGRILQKCRHFVSMIGLCIQRSVPKPPRSSGSVQ